MKPIFLTGLLFLALNRSLSAVEVGATFEQVVAEKGAPPGKIEAAGVQILNYPDQTIRLKQGKVVSVGPPAARVTVVAAPPTAAQLAKAAAERSGTAPDLAPGAWTPDCQAALALAKEQNKRVFLLFTCSDGSKYSQQFYDEVLTKPDFLRYAQKNLILVMIDFPKTIEQSPGLKAQNAKLLALYKIKLFPTVVVLDHESKSIGTLNFEEGGPAAFVDKLSKLKEL
jgi:protein disulfide-isomerase